MGKNYSYTVVVEPDARLFINQQVVPTPDEVTSNGEDVLGWALDQVRETFGSYHAQDQTSELTLKVEDRRPGGLKRRAKFTHPEQGISLHSLQAGRSRVTQEATTPAKSQPRTAPPPPKPVPATPTPTPTEPTPAPIPAEDESPGQVEQQAAPAEPAAAEMPPTQPAPPATEKQPPRQVSAPASPATPVLTPPRVAGSREEKLARERGWEKLSREKVTRPQIGSAENEGRSKRAGLLVEARKQKWVQSVGIALVILLVIVGFRVFNGGTTYEAFCVDQRTMTRTVTGVACEDSEDTNHRWWYTSNEKSFPGVGDSIDTEAGTFDEPSGDKDVIEKHVEKDD